MTSPELSVNAVNWPAAARLAGRLAPPGPVLPRERLHDLVNGLHVAAQTAVGHVHEVTRITPKNRPTPVLVVDRSSWAQANTQSMATLMDGLDEGAADQSDAAGSVNTAEVGTVLALLSGRVLGQYDPYVDPGLTGTHMDDGVQGVSDQGQGRLLLVAPNILHVETSLNVPPADFRLWVCLHEQTHAWQFAVAPWLAGYLRASTRQLLEDLSRTSAAFSAMRLDRKLAIIGKSLYDALRGAATTPIDGLLDSNQKRAIANITAVMALLEGHADVIMDAVGPRVVPTVRRIRAGFERRRDGAGKPAFDVVLRKLLGMDAKLAQYREGASFVREVEKAVGRDGLNLVWESAECLPTPQEIAEPELWVRRVCN